MLWETWYVILILRGTEQFSITDFNVINLLCRLNGGVCARAVKEGFKCILSDQAYWYLDHLDALWDKFYETEPYTNITDEAEQKLVIGGEVCMWGETADPSNVLQTIWPRAAAAAGTLLTL